MKIKEAEFKIKTLELGTDINNPKDFKDLLTLVKEVYDVLSSLNEKKFNTQLSGIKSDLEYYILNINQVESASITFKNSREKLFAESKQNLINIISENIRED